MLPAVAVARSSSGRLRYVMYFRFRRYVTFTHSGLYDVLLSGDSIYNRRNYCIDSNQILLNDQDDEQVYIAGCAPGAKSAIYGCLVSCGCLSFDSSLCSV